MKHTLKTSIALTLIALSTAVAHAAPVGMAAHLTGTPEYKGDGAWKPLRVLQRLEPGDAVRCGPGESAILVLFNGQTRYSIAANGTGTVSATGVAGAKALGGSNTASAAVAQRLAGARTGAVMARPAAAYQRLHAQTKWDVPQPKSPPAHDWLRADERSFAVNPFSSSQTYVFTLFDLKDYVVFSQQITPTEAGVQVTLPEEVKLESRRPYTWRLHGFKNGKLVSTSVWGLTTVLSAEDEAQLVEAEKNLLAADGKVADDPAQVALLAELYRSYGVLQNALELLDNDALSSQPGIETTRGEVFAQAGPYARMLADQARQTSDALAGDQ